MTAAAAPSPEGGRKRLWRLKVVALIVFVVGLVTDLVTKSVFAKMLHMDPATDGPYRAAIDVIPGFFALEGTYNKGITFGQFPGHPQIVMIFTLLAALALTAWLLATRRRSVLLHVSLGMVLAGAIGNLYDRFHWHKVRDFFLIYIGDLQNPSFKWPNFNVADSLIVVGVVLILGLELFGPRPAPASPTSASAGKT